jgi:hypothetical protein
MDRLMCSILGFHKVGQALVGLPPGGLGFVTFRRGRVCRRHPGSGDMIHQWDDPKDFSMWRNAFKALKP